eukprot:COSAG01_NODE_39882_length_470_cov_110.940701_1_plen_61_part_01
MGDDDLVNLQMQVCIVIQILVDVGKRVGKAQVVEIHGRVRRVADLERRIQRNLEATAALVR